MIVNFYIKKYFSDKFTLFYKNSVNTSGFVAGKNESFWPSCAGNAIAITAIL
ncbi:MAG: hypothetical protein ACJAYB_001428 [Psychromonas sp.]